MSGIKALGTLTGLISPECTLSGKLSVTGGLSGELSVIGGLSGELSVMTEKKYDEYYGDYEVVPAAFNTQTLETANKVLRDDILVKEVPFFETSNDSGVTVYIAREVD